MGHSETIRPGDGMAAALPQICRNIWPDPAPPVPESLKSRQTAFLMIQ
jgi:hypothetical protein